MKTRLAITVFVALAICLWPVAGVSGHVEGKETNVAILVCAIDRDPPYRIHVRSWSMNATRAQMPLVSTKTSCAQALHELMTAGFEIVESDLEYLLFVLTRIDPSTQTH